MWRNRSPEVRAAIRAAEAILPASGEIPDLLARLSQARGRPVGLLESPLPASVSGVLVSTEQGDYIVVSDSASPERACAVVCHEVAHLLLGHDSDPVGRDLTGAALLAALEPELARTVIAARHGYDHPAERDTETVATHLSVELRRRVLRGGYTYYDERWR